MLVAHCCAVMLQLMTQAAPCETPSVYREFLVGSLLSQRHATMEQSKLPFLARSYLLDARLTQYQLGGKSDMLWDELVLLSNVFKR